MIVLTLDCLPPNCLLASILLSKDRRDESAIMNDKKYQKNRCMEQFCKPFQALDFIDIHWLLFKKAERIPQSRQGQQLHAKVLPWALNAVMPLVAPAQRKPYTVEEAVAIACQQCVCGFFSSLGVCFQVLKHNTAASLWVIMNRKARESECFTSAELFFSRVKCFQFELAKFRISRCTMSPLFTRNIRVEQAKEC